VSFAAIILCVASQQVFVVVSIYFVMTQSGNFWIHPRIFEFAHFFPLRVDIFSSILFSVVKVKAVPVLFFFTEHHAMKAYWRSGGISSRILYLGPRRR
jgi:hypothetical protein